MSCLPKEGTKAGVPSSRHRLVFSLLQFVKYIFLKKRYLFAKRKGLFITHSPTPSLSLYAYLKGKTTRTMKSRQEPLLLFQPLSTYSGCIRALPCWPPGTGAWPFSGIGPSVSRPKPLSFNSSSSFHISCTKCNSYVSQAPQHHHFAFVVFLFFFFLVDKKQAYNSK